MRIQVVGIALLLLSPALGGQTVEPVRLHFQDCALPSQPQFPDVYSDDTVVGTYDPANFIPRGSIGLNIIRIEPGDIRIDDEVPMSGPSDLIEFPISLPEDLETGVYVAQIRGQDPEGRDLTYCSKFNFTALGGIIGNGLQNNSQFIRSNTSFGANPAVARDMSDDVACGRIGGPISTPNLLSILISFGLGISFLLWRRRELQERL